MRCRSAEQTFAAISIEMVYRSLYFFTNARARGEVKDVVAIFAAKQNSLASSNKHKVITHAFSIISPLIEQLDKNA